MTAVTAPHEERALLVGVSLATDDTCMDEFQQLVCSAGASIVLLIHCKLTRIQAKYYVGEGKVAEIKTALVHHQADLLIINQCLSPAQARNLEKKLCCRVIDRTGLILDIFAARARSYEGKLQVELAQCRYLATRLVRGWTHLERQKGGIGLRGPGETQLETDRRLLRVRIDHIQSRLAKVKNQRALGRNLRARSGIPVIALVGYTNAGKSTLFNTLCNETVFAADQLFATLDPTLRRVKLPGLGDVIFVDTVGFIQDLPHDLIAAFSATLEETRLADGIVHVVDHSDPNFEQKMTQVRQVLNHIQAGTVPEIVALNKIDRSESVPQWRYRQTKSTVWLSAETRAGIPLLFDAITQLLTKQSVRTVLILPVHMAAMRARLYERGVVCHEDILPSGDYKLSIAAPSAVLEHIFSTQRLKWQSYRQLNS